MLAVTTDSPAATAAWGERLGRLLAPGDFVALRGELGAGKTRFAQGVARGLEVDSAQPVTSPTFTLLNIYPGRVPLYHFDLYRLAGDDDVAELGFGDYFHGDGVCLVEWAERLVTELPATYLTITFAHAGEERRTLTFEPCGERFTEILAKLLNGPKKKL